MNVQVIEFSPINNNLFNKFPVVQYSILIYKYTDFNKIITYSLIDLVFYLAHFLKCVNGYASG